MSDLTFFIEQDAVGSLTLSLPLMPLEVSEWRDSLLFWTLLFQSLKTWKSGMVSYSKIGKTIFKGKPNFRAYCSSPAQKCKFLEEVTAEQ